MKPEVEIGRRLNVKNKRFTACRGGRDRGVDPPTSSASSFERTVAPYSGTIIKRRLMSGLEFDRFRQARVGN